MYRACWEKWAPGCNILKAPDVLNLVLSAPVVSAKTSFCVSLLCDSIISCYERSHPRVVTSGDPGTGFALTLSEVVAEEREMSAGAHKSVVSKKKSLRL